MTHHPFGYSVQIHSLELTHMPSDDKYQVPQRKFQDLPSDGNHLIGDQEDILQSLQN